MKPWVSNVREAVTERLALLRLSVRYTYQLETAHFFENWAGALSTIVYTVTYVLFIDVLFRNVPTFAGYERGEILFFMLVAQYTFYISWVWGVNNIQLLERDIRSGDFDMMLTKPVPLLFYALTKRISLVGFVRQSIAPLIGLSLVIPWSTLPLRPWTGITAFIIFILGQLALNAVHTILVLPSFWVAGVRSLIQLPGDIFERHIPAEALPRWFAIIFTVVIPLLFQTGIVVGVALGRLDALLALTISAGATAYIFWLRSRLWSRALRSYTSASS